MTAPSGGLLITSEQVLERLFRAGYARWIEEAKKRLGPDSAIAAPRVVSKAFHLAWTDRQQLRAQEDLDAYLGANIQHGAAREQSRRSRLHRMGSVGGGHKEAIEHDSAEMNVDEAWDRLKHALQGSSADEAQRERASTARHGAAEHMAALGKTGALWKPVTAVGVTVLGVAFAVWYLNRAAEDRAIQRAVTDPDVRSYATSYGQQANVTLDDGTVVLIGPDTKLSVPKAFGPELRAVNVVGVANFNVTREMEKPFDVRSGPVSILARGNVFTVRRYRDDTNVIVYARKGAVDVRQGKIVRQVAEGLSVLVPDSGTMRIPTAEEFDDASSWVDGTVSIVGSLRSALPLLKRWYGLDIRLQDTTLLDRKVFVRAPLTSQKEAISNIERSGGLKFTYIGDYMGFRDAEPTKGATKADTKKP
jgi:ferric-dicitrate binding protein FerR (iron transport regulator)